MGKMSRTKGRRFELFVRNALRTIHLDADRADQSDTSAEKPDVLVRTKDGYIAIECKRRRSACSLSYIDKSLQELQENNPNARQNCLVGRLDRGSPLVICDFQQFLEYAEDLSRQIHGIRGGDNGRSEELP